MSSDATYSATDAKDYAASAAVDLINDTSKGRACRRVRPLGTGNLVIKLAGSGGALRILAVTQNVDEELQGIAIDATNAVAVRVYW